MTTADDLEERLRQATSVERALSMTDDLYEDVAEDAIEALRTAEAERDRCREALKRISDHGDEVSATIAETALQRETCPHGTTRNLYDQRPPSEGRTLKPVRKLCEDCGTVLPHPSHVDG